MATIDRCLEIAKRVCMSGLDGRVVKTIGDEVLAVFSAADGAAQAAIEIQLAHVQAAYPRDTPVTMHIGFHSGPTIEDESDVFGDAVNVAARLTAFATGGQIFTSAQTAAELSPVLRARTRDQDSHTVRGKEQDVAMFELTWAESEEELTAMSPRVAVAAAKVKLMHGAREIELGEARSRLNLGRDATNDVVIADRKASRMHAHIERRRDKFVLVDHSSNGTWVTVEGKTEISLRAEFILRGRGWVSFGHAFADDPAEVVTFACLD